ncbi:hypothetical protein IW262DRAFT_1462086 [Armillaria fumosa]|nr:hypothetical protein IW262DRAFT_1462086 [Armillaria fumosa]
MKASEVINISSDEEEAASKNTSNEVANLQIVVNLLTKEIGELTRAQEHAEKRAAKYDELLESAGQAKSAQEEAEQQAKRYEVELNETQRQLRALQATYASLEEDIVCEICSLTMWVPFVLPDCGHTICETCIQSWLGRILDQHCHDSDPPFLWTQPVEIPEVATMTMMQVRLEYMVMLAVFEEIRKAMNEPCFNCLICCQAVKSRPVQAYTMKSIVQKVASVCSANDSAEGAHPPLADMHALAERVIIWDTLFPFHIPADPEVRVSFTGLVLN